MEFSEQISLIFLFWIQNLSNLFILNTHLINKLNRSVFNKKWAMVPAALCWCDWNLKLRWASNTIFTGFQLERPLRLSICCSWYCQQTPIRLWRHFVWIKLEFKRSDKYFFSVFFYSSIGPLCINVFLAIVWNKLLHTVTLLAVVRMIATQMSATFLLYSSSRLPTAPPTASTQWMNC